MWARQEIPHFRPVIDSVKAGEGIEITLTCNLDAFNFIIEYLEAHESNRNWLISERVTPGNCLSVMVTSEFLQLREIAHRVTKQSFIPNFEEIINACKLNLTTLHPKLMQDIAAGITYDRVLLLKPRQDKDQFTNNLLKLMIESVLASLHLFKCTLCGLLLT